jgi:hypothetical protein
MYKKSYPPIPDFEQVEMPHYTSRKIWRHAVADRQAGRDLITTLRAAYNCELECDLDRSTASYALSPRYTTMDYETAVRSGLPRGLFESNDTYGCITVKRFTHDDYESGITDREMRRLQLRYGVYLKLAPLSEGTTYVYAYSDPTTWEKRETRICKKCRALFSFDRADDKDRILCSKCAEQKYYGHKEFEHKNGAFDNGMRTFGFELEMSSRDNGPGYQALRDRLIMAGFVRTSDATVTDEMKSPVFGSHHVPGNLKRMLDKASRFTAASNVGTHVHIAFENADRMNRDRDYDNDECYCECDSCYDGDHCYGSSCYDSHDSDGMYRSIFNPLEGYLINNKASTQAIWGRYFVSHADYPARDTHTAWVHARGELQTLEWRLAKLRNYTQFNRLVQFLLKATSMIDLKLDREYNRDRVGQDLLQFYTKYFAEELANNN